MKYKKVNTAIQLVIRIYRDLLLPILLILFSSNLFAQTWPMPGAKWTYCLTGWNGMPAGEETFEFIGDTLISGKIYSIISDENISSENRRLFTRFSNDTVYRWVNNQEYMFFTFNLNVGDVFSTFRTAGWNNHWEDSACSSFLPLKVIEESEIELDGLNLKQFVLEDTLFSILYHTSNPEPVLFTLIERIGVLNSYPLINTMEPSGSCFLPSEWGEAELGKYTDDTFEYLFKECEGVGISMKKREGRAIMIFPNPATNFVNIVLQNNDTHKYEISILTHVGKLIYKIKMTDRNCGIDLSELKAGYYFVALKSVNSLTNYNIYPLIILH